MPLAASGSIRPRSSGQLSRFSQPEFVKEGRGIQPDDDVFPLYVLFYGTPQHLNNRMVRTHKGKGSEKGCIFRNPYP